MKWGPVKAMINMTAGALALLAVLSFPAYAQEYIEGTHYQTIDQPVRTDNPDKVEVVEMFGYWCPHCDRLERHLRGWKQQLPEQAYFKPIPVIFRNNQTELAKAYYVAELLDVSDDTHGALFNLIHRQNQTINNKEDMQDFFANYGVDAERFNKAYSSFSINSQLSLAKKRALDYGIQVVPTLVVNGKYRVTEETAGSQREMLEVVDFLVEKESR